MIMIYLTFLSALLLSGIAAYYSVIGLASIFVGAFWPVVFMGSSLEFAKVITTSWLYRNWDTVPRIMKYYLTIAVGILMLITSMGIFGYLSKSHLEQSVNIGPLADKVAIYDEKIKTLKENLDANRKTLKQLDEAVDQVMARSESERSAERSIQIRKSQQKERAQLSEEITRTQKEISKLNDEKAPLSNELRKAESDFGPIKYVAELIYGRSERDIIDKAVRVVIILIMVVFDPLAVLLLIAGNMSLAERERNRKKSPLEFLKERIDDKKAELKAEKEEKEILEEIIKVEKENITNMEQHDVVHETIETHHAPGLYSSETVPVKKLEPKYDYDDPYAFREKENK